MRSSRSIQLVFLGSALALIGCGGDQHAQKKPCPPKPDGTPDPNCAGNNRSHVRTGGFVFLGGMGGGGSNAGAVKSGVATSPSGTRTGGFGVTGRSAPSAAS
jgi:hypothetical protein